MPSGENAAPAADIPPLTAPVMVKLFAVPLAIIAVIVGCAVLVVLMFGSITTDRERSVSSLLDVLEGHVGERTAGVLLPNEKEVWQVGRELALRLQKKESELTPDELEMVVRRLSTLLARVSAESDGLSDMGRKQMHFVIEALSRTGASGAVDPIVAVLGDGNPATRREVLSALATLKDLPETHEVLPQLIDTLEDPDSVVRTVACVAVSAVAHESDPEAIEALGRVYFDSDREVRWNAALALARLGSNRGKSMLLDMLSRAYWENDVKIRTEGDGEYALPPRAIVRYLVAAVQASAHLNDAEVQSHIRALEADPSPAVKNAVRRVCDAGA